MLELVYPAGGAPVLPAAARFKSKTGAAVEWLPVVEPSGEVVAQASREFVHSAGNVLHPVVHLQIINRFGGIYLQKRSEKKDLLPGYWDTAVGGHVGYGETVMEALFREAREELGLNDFNPIPLDSYINETSSERELVAVFAIVGNFEPHPDLDEVADGDWWTEERISSAIGQGLLTPNFEEEYGRIKDALEALL